MRQPDSQVKATAAGNPPLRLGLFSTQGALLVIQTATLLAMAATVATKVWQDHAWFGFLLVGLAALAWSPEVRFRRERMWWFAFVAGIFAYTLLRSLADETGIPVRTSYPIQFDRALFFGTDPIQWLQDRFFQVSDVGALDVFSVGMHWSFFVAPYAMAVVVFFRKREAFPRYVGIVVGTMYLGLLLFFLVPTAPPWLAAQQGHLDGVYRVMDFVGGSVDKDTYRSFYASLAEPNSVAAMPSIHEGVTFAMYLWARENARRFAPFLLVYAIVMGLSLMYLGEHYLLDLIAGVACASAAWILCRRFISQPVSATQLAGRDSSPRS
ncbi:MAG: phosphatase PAP2 family protein [bacterium]